MEHDKRSSMVVPVLQKDETKVLLLKRADKAQAWSFLTERIDPCDGACFRSCALRGIREELNISLPEGSLIPFLPKSNFIDYKDRSVCTSVFLLPVTELSLGTKRFKKSKPGKVLSRTFNRNEVLALKWSTIPEAVNKINHEAYLPLYSKLLTELTKGVKDGRC